MWDNTDIGYIGGDFSEKLFTNMFTLSVDVEFNYSSGKYAGETTCQSGTNERC